MSHRDYEKHARSIEYHGAAVKINVYLFIFYAFSNRP